MIRLKTSVLECKVVIWMQMYIQYVPALSIVATHNIHTVHCLPAAVKYTPGSEDEY